MSNIQEKLDSLQPYVIGVRYVQGVQIVEAQFKKGWLIPNSDRIKKEFADESQNYYMFFSDVEGVTFDELLDFVDSIIKLNVEREMKYHLLKSKVEELKSIFKNNSYEKLKTIKFTFPDELVPSFSDMGTSIDDDTETLIGDSPEENTYSETDVESEAQVMETGVIDDETHIRNAQGQDIELPRRKIVVEDYSIPPEMTSGDCNCSSEEACPKCIDRKELV